MDYQIKYDKKAEKYLDKLPYDIRRRILRKLSDCKCNPYRYFERLSGREEYKLRVGKRRIIADINNNLSLIEIRLIDLRDKVYENRKA
jgi:mRNA-degrading endonuclease RelE of RelBE toxin-antitoxin system